jgi:hypothetical protein
MPLDERFDRWQFDPMRDGLDILPNTPPEFDNDGDLRDDGNGDESIADDSQLSMYRSIVTNSTAFQWLIRRVHRETILTASVASKMHAIATQIRQTLYSQRQNRLVSGTKGPPTCSIVFKSDWDPLSFTVQQEYAEEPDDAIEAAIVLVQGENEITEAMTCAEYLSRTWPLLGEDFMELVRHVVRSEAGLRCSSQSIVRIRVEGLLSDI